MRKRLLCGLLCGLLLLALSCGCASSGGGEIPSDGGSAEPSVSDEPGDAVEPDGDSPASWSNFDLDAAWS